MLALSAGAANAQLHKLAVAAGLDYFGTATDNGEITNTTYTAIASDADEFGQITPGNTQKWYYTESVEGMNDPKHNCTETALTLRPLKVPSTTPRAM